VEVEVWGPRFVNDNFFFYLKKVGAKKASMNRNGPPRRKGKHCRRKKEQKNLRRPLFRHHSKGTITEGNWDPGN